MDFQDVCSKLQMFHHCMWQVGSLAVILVPEVKNPLAMLHFLNQLELHNSLIKILYDTFDRRKNKDKQQKNHVVSSNV